MEMVPLTQSGNGRRKQMGKVRRLMGMINNRGIGIVMLQLKRSITDGWLLSPAGPWRPRLLSCPKICLRVYSIDPHIPVLFPCTTYYTVVLVGNQDVQQMF